MTMLILRSFGIAVSVALAAFAGVPDTAAAPQQPAILGGAERIEITPPPGFPTGGHGPAGDIARGDWMPLYARAYYFGTEHGPGIILVTCDLFAFPLGLRAAIWQAVRDTVAPLGVGPEGLV